MQDYEYAGLQRQLAFRAARRVLVPDAIPVEAMRRAGAAEGKLFRYPGLKEDYYLADFEPDPAVLAELGIDRAALLVVVRPPPETSAYHAAQPALRRGARPPRRPSGAVVGGDPAHRGPARPPSRPGRGRA